LLRGGPTDRELGVPARARGITERGRRGILVARCGLALFLGRAILWFTSMIHGTTCLVQLPPPREHSRVLIGGAGSRPRTVCARLILPRGNQALPAPSIPFRRRPFTEGELTGAVAFLWSVAECPGSNDLEATPRATRDLDLTTHAVRRRRRLARPLAALDGM